MQNTYRFYRREHGALATAAYRALDVAGAGARYLGARLRRDADAVVYWRLQLKAHVERTADRPVEGR
jgi:hypothetical protein